MQSSSVRPGEGVSNGSGAGARMARSRTAGLEAQKSWKLSSFCAQVSEDWQSVERVQVRGLVGKQKQEPDEGVQGAAKELPHVRPGRQMEGSLGVQRS